MADLHVEAGLSTQYQRHYFDAYMDRVVAEARDRGYTETLYGRRPRRGQPVMGLDLGRRQGLTVGELASLNAGQFD